MTLKQKFKLGVLVGEKGVTPDELAFLNLILAGHDIFYHPLLIKLKPATTAQVKGLGGRASSYFQILKLALARFILESIRKLEVSKIRRIPMYSDYGAIKAFPEQFETLAAEVLTEDPNGRLIFTQASRSEIAGKNLDLLLSFTSIHMDVSTQGLSRLGLLCCHYGDNRSFRDEPMGFWEVYLDSPSSGFTILQQEEGSSARTVLYRGNISTEPYWIFNLARVQKKTAVFLLKTLTKIALSQEPSGTESTVLGSVPIRTAPGVITLIHYLLKSHVFFAWKKLTSALFKTEKYNWSVSYLQSGETELALNKAKTVKNPKGRFLADPFLIEYSGEVFCFVEDYFKDEQKGKISVLKVVGQELQMLGVVLEEDFHLSFPFVFKCGEDIYMIPETSRANAIRIYRATAFPLQWEFVMSLIDGIRAVDTVVFESDRRWYLLTNFCSAGIGDNSSELHLYSSDTLLSKSWVPAAQNPVIFNSTKARNGGFYLSNGRKFRVGQVQGKGHYGKSCTINEIVRIGVNDYEEIQVSQISPDFFHGLKSTHHYHCNDWGAVFDHQ